MASVIVCISAVASNDASGGAHGQTTGQGHRGSVIGSSKRFPCHLDGLDGIGQAFQGQLPEGPVFMTTAPSGGQSHPHRRQDLSALAYGTQACCFNDRVPEAIVVLSGHFPTAEAHPQAHGVFSIPVVPFDALLHGHRTGQGGGRRSEHHHEPVSEVLHLGATGLGDRLAQDREVPSADLFSGVGRQSLRQLRRAHHVGEQDRCALDGQETPLAWKAPG